ncbi:hypothetical protein I6N95_09575 [Vagococcus sp. BWB3-3]|uniref:Phage tail tape measure protein n=1 Tax=Vagococcus allomyrinae TaxID=2794353 RepID=A0A940P579_9ENTE|nr:hypothetical protein [Vagococcus allomyrinae]MBP1041255.1 hypothetical protein [Vagococcus allomyrinae]
MELFSVEAILSATDTNLFSRMNARAEQRAAKGGGSSGGAVDAAGKLYDQTKQLNAGLGKVSDFLSNASSVNAQLSEFAATFGFEAVGQALQQVSGFLDTAQTVGSGLGVFTQGLGQMSSGVETAQILMMEFADPNNGGFGALGSAISGLVGGPWVLLAAGIVALVAGFIYLWNTNEGFRTAVIEIWTMISETISNVITTIAAFISEVWGSIVTWWTDSNNQVRLAAENVWSAISEVISSIVTFISMIVQTVWGALTAFWTAHNETIKTVASAIWNGIKAIIEGVINGISMVIGVVLGVIQAIWQGTWNTIQTYVATILNVIATVIRTGLNIAKGIVSTVMSLISGDWSGAWNGVKETVTAAWEGVKEIVRTGIEGAYNIIAGWFNTFKDAGGNLVKMIGDGILAGVKFVTNAIDTIVGKIRDFLPFSPAKTGPLSDLDQLNFGGTIATGIYAGEAQIKRAMDSILSTPSLSELDKTLNSSNQQTIHAKSELLLTPNKQSAVFTVNLGNQQFRAFVDDISQAIGGNTELNLAF